MLRTKRLVLCLVVLTALVACQTASTPATGGESMGMSSLAAPLAQQFGVSPDLVTGLMESGVSLDSVTQLLLVSQSSDKDFEEVSSLYSESGNKIDETAKQLEVAKSEYSMEKVSAAIDEAKQTAQASASKKAGEAASGAVDSALGGMSK